MAARKRAQIVIDAPAPTQQIYPFETLRKGGTFLVTDISKWSSVRSIASRKGATLGRTFKVTKTEKGIEVRRTA